MKSKFKNLNFASIEIMSAEEQSKVKGGYLPGSNPVPVLYASFNTYAWESPGYISASGQGATFPNSGAKATCYKNVYSGEYSRTQNGSGWMPVTSGCPA